MVKRVLTALIAFPLFVALIVLGNKYIMDVFVTIALGIAMHEYLQCVSSKGARPIKWLCYLSVLGILCLHIVPLEIIKNVVIFAIPTLLLLLNIHVIATNMKITFEDICYTLMGIMYLVGFGSFVSLVYGLNDGGNLNGKFLIWFIMAVSWGSDTFALLFGVKFGKHKFSKVSPKKSIEGCIAGNVCGILIALIISFVFNKFFGMNYSYLIIGASAFVLNIIGQIGDLSASVIKRYFEVKDYSNLFPGHGGMIDRSDSVIYIAPFAYLLFTLFL